MTYRVVAARPTRVEEDQSMLSEIVWDADTLGVVFGCGIPIVATIGFFWYKIVKTTSEAELKRSMIERGMSADEIERVLAAEPTKVK